MKDTKFCTDEHKTDACNLTLPHFTQSSSRPLPMISLERLLWKWGRRFSRFKSYRSKSRIYSSSQHVWVQHEIQAESPLLKVVNHFIVVTPFCTFKCLPLTVPLSLWSLSFSGFDKSLTIFSSVSLIQI